MTLVVTVPDQPIVGTPLTVTGTGWDVSEAHTCHFSNPDETLDVTLHVNSSGGGALDFSTAGKVVPQTPGVWTVTVSDDDDPSNVVVETVEVFQA